MIYPNCKKAKNLLRRTTAVICALLLTLSVLTVAASAQKAQTNTVRVGYYENEVFEEGAEEGAVKNGYAYEYYRKLSEYTGWEYEYVYGDFTNMYQKLLRGEVDLLAGLAYKEDRADLIGYPELPMGSESYSLIKHSDNTTITAEPSTLNGVSIGVLESAMVDVLKNFLTKHSVEAEVVTFNDYQDLFNSFDNEEVDVMAAEGDGAYGRNHTEVVCSFGSSDYFLCVSKKRPDLLETLNSAQTMLAAEEPGYLNNLKEKYYAVSVASRAYSAAEREWLDTHDSIKIGYLEDYLPYSDTDKDGKVTGLIKDYVPILLETLDQNDISVTYKGYSSYDQMVSDLDNDLIDLAFPVGGGLYYSEMSGIYLSNPVLTATTVLVFAGEYSDDTVKSFAVNENNRMQYYFTKKYYPDAEIIYFENIYECLNAVKAGVVSCTTISGLRANDILRNAQYDSLSQRLLAVKDDHCFGVNIGNEGLLKLVNRGINIIGTDSARSLSYRYTSELYHYTTLEMLRNNMPLIAAAILIIALIVIFFLFRDAHRKRTELQREEASRLELQEKNDELAHNKEALSDALVAAEHANRAKTSFLNNMSHDIRTPMNAIVGFTAMAAAHLDNKEAVQDYLNKISISSRHLLSLINDVLDMSRIESGNMRIEKAEVHLPDVIHDLRTIVHSSVKAKQLDLFIDTQDVKNEDIITDKLRLSQVLLNILSNAVKFTPPGGTITFRVIEKPIEQKGMTSFEFRIKDNGIGMSEEFQKNIFEAFTRERTSTVSKIDGTGLGMAITKNIVDMMGGSISVTSEVDKGSEFVVTMPCKISEHAIRYELVPELQGLRALVADDDTNTCLSVCAMLRDIGMRPDWTNYGKEAVIRAKEAYEQSDKFKVYIIDWLMPDQNGIETVRQIRKVIGDSDPIIVMTAYDWSEIEEEAREAGVTAFCSKPLFMSELRHVLSHPFSLKEEAEAKKPEMPDFSGTRILLAEDNELNRIIAVSILEEAGFIVDVAENGVEAYEMVKESVPNTYAAVLMDIQMPLMNGYEAAKQIRLLHDPAKAEIPIIAVTANAFDEDRRIALEAGMNSYLAKPYDIPKMMETLQDILKK